MLSLSQVDIALDKLLAFFRKPLLFKLWFVPAWLLLGLSKAMIFLVSFRKLERFMGHWHGTNPAVHLLSAQQYMRASQIGHLVRVVSRYTPWNSNCFPQALTAAIILRIYRVPYLLCFGLARDDGKGGYLAHAWVVSGKVAVTGGYSFNKYHVVACYLEPKLIAVDFSVTP